jgi:hypothetical protein
MIGTFGHALKLPCAEYCRYGGGNMNANRGGDETNRVRVDVRGARIKVWINGKRVIRYTDANPIRSGGIGLMGIWESTPAFDNIIVSRLGKPCPATGR